MKKQWLLIMTTSVMFSLSGLTIVSCSTQAEQKPENPDQKILKDEIARIEKIKSDFKLKNSEGYEKMGKRTHLFIFSCKKW